MKLCRRGLKLHLNPARAGKRPSRIPVWSAFTLIELMVAIMILSLLMATVYSTWWLILRASKNGQAAAAQAQRERITMQTIQEALTSIQSFQASMPYYTFIVQNGDQPLLSFTSRLPDSFPRGGRFGGFHVRRLTFTVEPGPNSEKDLMLRQSPILMDMDQDEKETPLVLARNVQTFEVECWDTNSGDWSDQWIATNTIPPMVRVDLILGGNNNSGDSTPVFATSQIISIPSQTMPAMLQGRNGLVGGGILNRQNPNNLSVGGPGGSPNRGNPRNTGNNFLNRPGGPH